MKAIIFLICLLSISVSATLITIDPDEFAAGTDISNAWAGVTLSSGGGASGLNGKVYTASSTTATTGSLVFANNRTSSKLWLNTDSSGYYLQVDFAIPTSHVLIDIISDGGNDFPALSYSTNGTQYTLIQDYPVLGKGQSYTAKVPLREIPDILSIRVGGLPIANTSQYAVLLDNLRYEQVPEPLSGLLLLSGAALLRARKK